MRVCLLLRIGGIDFLKTNLRRLLPLPKVGVISHIFEFLSVLSPLCRESYLHTLTEIFDSGSPLNWRMRHIVARQLPDLINLFELNSVQSSILPLIISLLRDPVSEVRDK